MSTSRFRTSATVRALSDVALIDRGLRKSSGTIAGLQEGDTHDVFVYRGLDQEVVLRNDCRSYPLKVRTVYQENITGPSIRAVAGGCREMYGVSF